jgi:serine/threonine-protein kinase
VALKTFPLSRTGGPNQEESFLREARLIARLSHPNIVTIYDSGHMEDLYYIAMEYVQGEDLKVLVKRKGPLSLEEVRQIMRHVCSALDYAHSQQVLHRDIKPGNVILRPTTDVKVVDFGLAKILSDAQARDPEPNDDSQRTLIGTPQYMAPEQILAGAVDQRTDIYSLGLTLFYLLTGRTPFDVKKVTDPLEVSRMQVHSGFPRPSTLRATLPRKVDEVFLKCTQKSPDERYQSVADFVEDFQKV